MNNEITSVTITKASNGFCVDVMMNGKMETYVATSIKDSYSYGSVSLVGVLDSLFNPREEDKTT